MGLDRYAKTPCGFCFVEYYSHQDALDCMKYIGGTKLDERIIRTDLDPGFVEGRQYGYAIYKDWICYPNANGVLVVENLEAKFETNTETNLIPGVEDTAVLLRTNEGKRKKSMVKVGRLVRCVLSVRNWRCWEGQSIRKMKAGLSKNPNQNKKFMLV